MDPPKSSKACEDDELNLLPKNAKAWIPKRKLAKKALEVGFSRKQASYSQMLLQEEAGCLELEEGEELADVTQGELKKAVDITSATKCFNLSLPQFGPYKIDYTLNGRHLLIGGRRGHLACFDWVTKRLHSEVNVMEEICDVVWLHQETMHAVAQKDWVYIYDNQGIELHCIKQLHRVMRLEFLPYHFLLASASDKSYLSWLDVSVGKLVAQTHTRLGRLDVMCQNPNNAVLVLGHAKGTVTMWSPSIKEPLVSMLCHMQPVRGVAVDPKGNYIATIATGRSMKIWDIRTFKCLQEYCIPACANHVKFSQRGLLAVSMGNTVQIYKDNCTVNSNSPYLIHRVGRTIHDLAFCPYEDVLGIGHEGGFSSILVPGAGEPNFDALERNPFQTKSQRREAEVKTLLEKIQPEMIVLDPYQLNRIASDQTPTIPRSEKDLKLEQKRKSGPSTLDVRRKQAIRDEQNRKLTKAAKSSKRKKIESEVQSSDVLDRFKPKIS